jgi:hypothetical protein
MFTPDLDLTVVTRCSKFRIQDKTGVDTGAQTKWSGTTGLDPTTLDSVIIRVISPSVVSVDYEVLTDIPTGVTGTFYFSDLTGTGEDGLHTIIYRLQVATGLNISAFIDYNSTVAGTTKVTLGTHGMTGGMYIDITGTTNYDGEYYVMVVNSTNIYITKDWIADDATGTGTRFYQSTFYPYVYCRSEAGVEKLYANLSRIIKGPTRDEYMEQARTVDGLLKALKSAISSANVTALVALQAEIDQILEFYDVDPNL